MITSHFVASKVITSHITNLEFSKSCAELGRLKYEAAESIIDPFQGTDK